jgi:glycosyltransferase involved in cell wall biosynthesis
MHGRNGFVRDIVINGRFLSQPVTGVQRYAREITQELNSLLQSDTDVHRRYQFEILAPSAALSGATFANIPVRRVGNYRGHLWEQLELPRFAADALVLNFANTGPLRVRNQITTIHDASVFAAVSGYSATFRLWYKFMHRQIGRRAVRIVTDSQFSRSELAQHCKVDEGRCVVIPLGGEHILGVTADNSVLARYDLPPGRFVLAAGSLNPNKNLSALTETARRLDKFRMPLVIAGGGNARVFQSSCPNFPDTVKFLGYVSDAELRALYQSARCFVFPSRYEGFGLPPLEAMACGCPVVSSNAASLPEVCGTAALMVDPGNPNDIASAVSRIVQDDILHADLVRRGSEQASHFRWSKSVKLWINLLDSLP